MKVRIKRIDKNINAPEYQTGGSTCADAYSRLDVVIEPKNIGYIPLNFAVEIPKNYFIMLAVRSSTHKLGLIPANGVGILDEDFNGDGDECVLIVYNITDEIVVIPKNTRIAQIALLKYEKIQFEEVDKLGNPDTGGLGSTGNN